MVAIVTRFVGLSLPIIMITKTFQAGTNIRALVVQAAFMAICIPGLVNTINPNIAVPEGFKRLYAVNWFINTVGPIGIYWLIYRFWPDKQSLVPFTISGHIDASEGINEDGEVVGSKMADGIVVEKAVEKDDISA